MTLILPFSESDPGLLLRDALLAFSVDPGGLALTITGGCEVLQVMESFEAFFQRLPHAWPMVRVPRSVDWEGLLGGLDFERSVRERRHVETRGLLQGPSPRVLLVEGLIGRDPPLARRLLSHAASLSRSEAVLIVETRADEGALPKSRTSAVVQKTPTMPGRTERSFFVRAGLIADLDGQGAMDSERADERLLLSVLRARERLASCHLAREQEEALAKVAVRAGVSDLGADLQAVRFARLHAALRGRTTVEEDDLEFAAAVALWPNAQEPWRKGANSRGTNSEPQGGRTEATGAFDPDSGRRADKTADGERLGAKAEPPRVLAPKDVEPMAVLPIASEAKSATPRSGRNGPKGPARRGPRNRIRNGYRRGQTPALAATLRAALARQVSEGIQGRLQIRKGDLRHFEHRDHRPLLHLLLVDVSGSMARNRMQEAKGLALSLLKTAYLARDRVSMVTFGGGSARLLLPPTSAPMRVHSLVSGLPVFGGTPLPAALLLAAGLIRLGTFRKFGEIKVVLITDGHANVPSKPPPENAGRGESQRLAELELEALASEWKELSLPTTLVDTTPLGQPRHRIERLARILGAQLVRLPGERRSEPGQREPQPEF